MSGKLDWSGPAARAFRVPRWHLLLEPDPSQQAHGFDVVAVLEEVRPHDAFGGYKLAVGEHRSGRDDFRRQFRQRGHMSGRHLGVLALSGHPIERLQRAPAGRQGRIDIDCLQERLDRLGSVAQRDKAMPSLLIQTAEAGMMPLEPLQGGKRLGNSLQITLADGNHVEDVAVLRNLDGQGLGRAQRGAELIALEESSNTQDFRFDGGCDWCCRGCLHCFQKKGGPRARL